ncbi:MAG TPA: alanine racemase [Stellaceae bacterium]|nr:alanine racemase [Stellaceae bacterium]
MPSEAAGGAGPRPLPSSAAEDRAGAVLDIDLGAIVENWRALGRRVGPAASCAGVVKADAYGLGMARVAPALAAAGCRLFFVAHLDEAISLRRLLPDRDIAVLNGLLPGTAADFTAFRLMPVLNDLGQVEAWRRHCLAEPATGAAILHIDTGMARLGLAPDETARLKAERERLGGIRLFAIMSHLACADEPAHPLNAQQLDRFRTALSGLPPAPASLAASSGIFLGPDYHFTIARPGAAVYGVNPQPGRPNPMAQAVILKGRIIQTRDVDRGDTVGYGATHRLDRPGRIATVAVGYADGWLRSLSNRGGAVIAGQPVPLIGRVSMDLITLDVSGLEPHLARPGAFVELIGRDRTVDDVAAEAGTIGYEILTLLGRRYHRVYRDVAAS